MRSLPRAVFCKKKPWRCRKGFKRLFSDQLRQENRKNRTEQDRTGTEQDRTGQTRTEQNKENGFHRRHGGVSAEEGPNRGVPNNAAFSCRLFLLPCFAMRARDLALATASSWTAVAFPSFLGLLKPPGVCPVCGKSSNWKLYTPPQPVFLVHGIHCGQWQAKEVQCQTFLDHLLDALQEVAQDVAGAISDPSQLLCADVDCGEVCVRVGVEQEHLQSGLGHLSEGVA